MLYIIFTAVTFLVEPAVADSNSTATIHGAVYSWDTLEPLDNTVIYVNSTPTQYIVAKNGMYSVELVPGNYTITAKYYQNSVLTYSIEENIEIKDAGNYVLDLLLPSVYSEELMDGSNTTHKSQGPVIENFKPKDGSQGLPKTGDLPVFSGLISNSRTLTFKQSRLYSLITNFQLVTFTIILLFLGGYLLSRTRKNIDKDASHEEQKEHMIRDFLKIVNMPKISVKFMDKGIDLERKEPGESKEEYPEQKTELVELGPEGENKKTFFEEPAYNPIIETLALKKKLVLSADLQEVLDIIRRQGGQITQKDLRSKLKHSEVKVCLMLTDLEKRKRIKKFKRGRENIVILIDGNR